MSTQQLLEAAINRYGVSDIRILELSQKRDKEIVEEQKELHKAYKEGDNVLSICS